MEGVDYSTARPSPAGLYAAGKRFAVRYGGAGTPDKWLSVSEAEALTRAGLSIVANVEGTARGLNGGYAVGVTWAGNANGWFRRCGMPPDQPIYLSADWDVQAVEWPNVAAALRGAAAVIGADRVGIYGGRNAIRWAQRDGVARWFWQTYAWSGTPTQWLPGTHIQQYRNGVMVAGGDCDLNRSMMIDFGQWSTGRVAIMGSEWHDGDVTDSRLSQGTEGYAGQQRDTALAFAWQAAQEANNGVRELLARPAIELTDEQLVRLFAALGTVVERAVENVLARTDLVTRPGI